MKLITQARYSRKYKRWSMPETCWYVLMRASSKLNICASFFYNAHKRLSCGNFVKRWRRKRGDTFVFDFNGVLLPDVSGEPDMVAGLKYVFEDVFLIPVSFGNDYSAENVRFVDQFTAEGPYGLIDERVDVDVKPGDVVFDVGAWIGDFSALAAAQGAKVYAFEPTNDTYLWLCRTVELSNGEIIPVQMALGDKYQNAEIILDQGGGGSNRIDINNAPPPPCITIINHSKQDPFPHLSSGDAAALRDKATSRVEVTTMDRFVTENRIEKVDFIKADIEGAERYMLKGATETLRRFAPKLAICTYHLKDDPRVLEGIIKEANPAYTVVHTRHKLFASVKQ